VLLHHLPRSIQLLEKVDSAHIAKTILCAIRNSLVLIPFDLFSLFDISSEQSSTFVHNIHCQVSLSLKEMNNYNYNYNYNSGKEGKIKMYHKWETYSGNDFKLGI